VGQLACAISKQLESTCKYFFLAINYHYVCCW